MSLKKNFRNILSRPEKSLRIFYVSSKWMFIITAFLFFLSYFFVSASFYEALFSPFLLHLYLSFLLSFIMFLCFSLWYFGFVKLPKWLLIFLSLICVGVGILFLLPVL